MENIIKFEVGATYETRSACDHDCIYSFTVIARTAKQITIREHGREDFRRGIFIYDGQEKCKPYGTYSMCPVISADRKTA